MSRSWKVGFALTAALLVAPVAAHGQQRVFVEGSGGVAIPAAGLNRFADPGGAAAVNLGYRISDRFAVKLTGGLEALNGVQVTGGTRTTPDMTLAQYGAALDATLFRSQGRRWQINADLGAGATNFNSDRYTWQSAPTTQREFSQTYFTTQGGLKVAYAPTSRFAVNVGTKASWAFAKKSETQSLANIDPTRLQPFATAMTIPVTLGMTVRL